MKEPTEYTSLNLREALRHLEHLQLSFKKRIFDQSEMDLLRGRPAVQQLMLTEINKVVALRNKVKKFRDNLLKKSVNN